MEDHRILMNVFTLMRAIVYAAVFIGLVLIYVPARLIAWTGIIRSETFGIQQFAGMVIGTVGAVIAIWCVLAFGTIGQGTPAPFDPPRRLVVRGPYRFVRNPMYIGAGLALAGTALFYKSLSMLGYTALFFLVSHLFVLGYEEPTLRRTFGESYAAYCRRVGRWWPRF
jgi:protein-S-isoprenylcysteine O-methyltransferase Ste14